MPKVRSSFVASSRTYGARRVWRDVLADGISCGLHKIERLMRGEALRAELGMGPRQAQLGGVTSGGASTSSGSSERRGRAVALASLQRARSRVHGGAGRTRSGSQTSPISGQPKAGFTWRP